MGVISGSILAAIVFGLAAAVPAVVLRSLAVPLLARRDARPAAYGLVAVPSLIAFVIAAVGIATGFPAASLSLAIAGFVALAVLTWLLVDPAIMLTGGPAGSRPRSEATLAGTLDAAERSFRSGDIDSWVERLGEASTLWSPATVEIHDTVRRLLASIRADQAAQIARLHGELAARTRVQWPPPAALRRGAGILLAATIIGTIVPATTLNLHLSQACREAEELLARKEGDGATRAESLDMTVARPPESGAIPLRQAPWDLEEAAASRHDPDTRDQLVRFGFVQAYVTDWRAADGRLILVDGFEFEARRGAVDFQRAVTRYACRFSNVAFAAPEGGIGLQVRYDEGDPIVEQVSWVVGSRRIVASISLRRVPADHDRILEIVRRIRP